MKKSSRSILSRCQQRRMRTFCLTCYHTARSLHREKVREMSDDTINLRDCFMQLPDHLFIQEASLLPKKAIASNLLLNRWKQWFVIASDPILSNKCADSFSSHLIFPTGFLWCEGFFNNLFLSRAARGFLYNMFPPQGRGFF